MSEKPQPPEGQRVLDLESMAGMAVSTVRAIESLHTLVRHLTLLARRDKQLAEETSVAVHEIELFAGGMIACWYGIEGLLMLSETAEDAAAPYRDECIKEVLDPNVESLLGGPK